MKLDSESIGAFVNFFESYGFWGILVFVLIIWGLPQVAPIISAFGAVWNERRKIELSHNRSMIKLKNKSDQDLIGKEKGK